MRGLISRARNATFQPGRTTEVDVSDEPDELLFLLKGCHGLDAAGCGSDFVAGVPQGFFHEDSDQHLVICQEHSRLARCTHGAPRATLGMVRRRLDEVLGLAAQCRDRRGPGRPNAAPPLEDGGFEPPSAHLTAPI